MEQKLVLIGGIYHLVKDDHHTHCGISLQSTVILTRSVESIQNGCYWYDAVGIYPCRFCCISSKADEVA